MGFSRRLIGKLDQNYIASNSEKRIYKSEFLNLISLQEDPIRKEEV